MQTILDRLDELERQNKQLLSEIQELRETIKTQAQPAPAATDSDRIDVIEQRTRDLAETKVGTSQHLPISLTGMFLLDTTLVTGPENDAFLQNYGDYSEGLPGGTASLRQSIIGLDFEAPQTFGGAKVHGSVSMDFYSQSGSYDAFRLRRGNLSFEWSNRTLSFGQERPLISPLEPTSYARVGLPPLSGSGNLWLWRPQVSYEERLRLGTDSELKLQGQVIATNENYLSPSLPAGTYISPIRPGAEERVEYRHHSGDETRWSIGLGSHQSSSHVAGRSVPSRVISSDFLYRPASWFELSGTLLHGENFANLGGLPTGVTIAGTSVNAIRGNAGWLQAAFPVTSRLTFDLYAGRQSNLGRDLMPYDIARTLTYAGNVLYRVGPNVIFGFEGSHENVVYLNGIAIPATRYDATVAYLF